MPYGDMRESLKIGGFGIFGYLADEGLGLNVQHLVDCLSCRKIRKKLRIISYKYTGIASTQAWNVFWSLPDPKIPHGLRGIGVVHALGLVGMRLDI